MNTSSWVRVLGVGLAITSVFAASHAMASTKVAFIGDQGTGSGARAVLKLIVDRNVDLIVLQGDLGYGESPATWGRMMDDVLGSDFPVLSVAGNHDRHEWPEYQRWLERRVDKVGGLRCKGDVGVKARCTFDSLSIVQTAPGVKQVSDAGPDDDYAGFIDEAFDGDDSTWRICSFHKNQRDMQTGDKGDSTGWGVYEACREAGAMIVTGHEHAYSRTHLLDDFESHHVVDRDDDLRLQPGRTIAVVSGLGGRDPREQKRGGDWWASVYTASQGATDGALICDFADASADCRFMAVNGAEPDRFTLRTATERAAPSDDGVASSTPSDTGSVRVPFVFSRSDKAELRWIARSDDGRIGSIRISATCAQRLGGATRSGNWRELMSIAPAFDQIGKPCDNEPSARILTGSDPLDSGFVFSRTDKNERRWIAPTDDGERGSIWISADCADSLGVQERTGSWRELMTLAPAFDAIDSPCN